MGWLEFTVVVGCGLIGFMVVNAVIDRRRSRAEMQIRDEQEYAASQRREFRTEIAAPFWWEILHVDENASPEQVKTAFRREISKYHPDRVEGLGVELQQLADRKAKEVNQAYALAKQERRFT
jgi:DnaJ-domain-containing protein 1